MAQIKSGATSDLWTIDPTSKAGRVTLYDSSGNEVAKPPGTGSYILQIPNGRITAAIGAGSTLWAMRNGATKTLSIRRVLLTIGFDGTGVATTSLFELVRFSTAAPTGGTAITANVVKKKNSYGASTLADARFNSGAALSVVSVVFEAAFGMWGVPRGATGAVATVDARWRTGLESYDTFNLAINEGIAIRCTVATVIGDSFKGMIEWDEN